SSPPLSPPAPPLFPYTTLFRSKSARQPSDGPALLDFFRKRTQPDLDREKIAALVRDLGNDSQKAAEGAARELIALGTVTVPWLRSEEHTSDSSHLGISYAVFCL